MTAPHVLVAGVGNVFLGDDGFGVAVAATLAEQPVPDGVEVADYGIRGVHLAYDLLAGYDVLVLVDAVPAADGPAGSLVVFEVDTDATAATMDGHRMDPATVLATLATVGASVDRVVVVGCRPETLEEGMGLSPTVAAAVPRAVEAVHAVLADIRALAGKGR